MELPLLCRDKLEALVAQSDTKPAVFARHVAEMTAAYKEDSGHGAHLVTGRDAVLAYAVTRMPATFGAVTGALTEALSTLGDDIPSSLHTVLDLGAGTGTATLAVTECLPAVTAVTAVEREPEMLSLGKVLTAHLPAVTWEKSDVLAALERYVAAGVTFDMTIASYMTNELSDEVRAHLLPLLLRVTKTLLLLVEPGTKVGSAILRDARTALIGLGASVTAPCPGDGVCPISGDDWCHFTARVQRSRLHKQFKGGDVPYEDEKFSYLAVTPHALPHTPCGARILRHPQKEPGRITVTLCKNGEIAVETVTKKDKERFTRARKATAGDVL